MYNLAYLDGNKIITINEPAASRNIAGIVTFTLNFNDVNELKNDLYKKGLIPNSDVTLVYSYTRKSGNYTNIKIVNQNRKIYTKEDKKFFISKHMKEFLDEYKYDPDFTGFLFSEYLISLGVAGELKNYLASLRNDRVKLLKIMSSLLEIPLSNDVYEIINKIIDSEDIDRYLSEFIKTISINQYDLINTFKKLRDKFEYRQIPLLWPLERLYNISVNASQMGIKNFENSPEFYRSSEPEIREFVNRVIYIYDSKTKNYALNKDGSLKIDKRKLFDLGVLLEEYNAYINSYMQVEENKIMPEEEIEDIELDDSHESDMYLEEDDFLRIGVDPEEAGFKFIKK